MYWTGTTATANLKAVVAPSILAKIINMTTLDTCFNKMVGIKYPHHHKCIYDEKFLAVKQSEYYLIGQRQQAMRQEFIKFAICANLKIEPQNGLKTDYFMRGLDDITKIEMARTGKFTREEIMSACPSLNTP